MLHLLDRPRSAAPWTAALSPTVPVSAAPLAASTPALPWAAPAQPPVRPAAATRADVENALAAFAPITLSQMNSVALLDRVESKYMLTTAMLLEGLERLRRDYAVLEIEGRRLNRYRTLYFDTDDFELYRRHHAGARDRYKVRSREYVESHLTFLEVKHKTNKKRTIKSRVETPELITELSGEPAYFVNHVCPFDAMQLLPRLWNQYSRVTLVNLQSQERLTLDLGLRFEWEGRTESLPGLVIAELKQQGRSKDSPFLAWAADCHLRTTGFSKYCVGATMLYPELKANRFKASHRMIARLLQGDSHDAH